SRTTKRQLQIPIRKSYLPYCSEVCCKNGDYATIKQQLDQQKENCKTHLAEKEKQIISQIITEYPDGQVVDDLQQQLKEKGQIIADLSKPSEEIKEQLVKLSQELGLSDQVQQSLQSATSYSELVSKQNQVFSEKIQGVIKQKQMARK
ncbi:21114_t:CDS:2, partial [Racocetra persica]